MLKRGFYFKTNKGNLYGYDDYTGNVNICEEEMPINPIVSGKLNTEDLTVDKNEIKEYLNLNGFRQLVLMITEECNIRCKYCVYSGNYSNTREHNNSSMSVDTAKKAVKQYLLSFKDVKYKNPFLTPSIGFYGGEPLLNYQLIKEVVQYCKEIYPNNIQFNTTTNAVLLDEEKIMFFASNNFALSISLNGDKEEHDRLRVFRNGDGTFELMSKNLNKIRLLYPEYYKSNCSIIITFDTKTNLTNLNNFIADNKNILPTVARINPVSNLFTDWYDQYSEEDKLNHKNELLELRELYSKQLKEDEVNPLLTNLFGLDYFRILNRILNIKPEQLRPKFLKYTGACVPGTKLAVNCNGDLICCERVSESITIGNVDSWIDYDKVSDIICKYNSIITKECSSCPIQRLCDLCYSHFTNGNGEFVKPSGFSCEKIVDYYRNLFSKTWDLMEDGIDLEDIIRTKKEKRNCGV